MTVLTHVQGALARVADERTRVVEKRTAFEEFERIVRDLSAAPLRGDGGASRASSGGSFTVTQPAETSTYAGDDRCRRVREAFAETVRPHSVDDVAEPEPLVETIAEELGRDLALLLAPGSGGSFTPATKRALLEAVADRKRELAVMERALDAERRSLRSARDEIEAIVECLREANEARLTDLGFDDLRGSHETLATHRARCEEIARDRQTFLQGTTSRDATVGIGHRTLVEYLYAALPVDHPVLVTVTRLDRVCADCQRVVRDHLVRRV